MNEKLISELCKDYEYNIIDKGTELYLEDLQDEELNKNTNWEELKEFFIGQYENKLNYVSNDKETELYFKNIIEQLKLS